VLLSSNPQALAILVPAGRIPLRGRRVDMYSNEERIDSYHCLRIEGALEFIGIMVAAIEEVVLAMRRTGF